MEQMETFSLTSKQEDYLEAIFLLEKQNGAARARDIAEALGVSRPAVTSTLRTLADKELIQYEPYSLVRLTANGQTLAEEVFHRHAVLESFFRDVLHLDQGTAESSACGCEHSVNEEVVNRLGQFLVYLKASGFHEQDWRKAYARLHNAKDTSSDPD